MDDVSKKEPVHSIDKRSSRESLSSHKQIKITTILNLYNDINSKIGKVIPLLSEIIILSIDLNGKIKYDPYLKARFKMNWITRTILVAISQFKKNLEYMEMVDNKKSDIINEYIEQGPAFE